MIYLTEKQAIVLAAAALIIILPMIATLFVMVFSMKKRVKASGERMDQYHSVIMNHDKHCTALDRFTEQLTNLEKVVRAKYGSN